MKTVKIKTFPIQFTDEDLERIRGKAVEQNVSIKKFILDAIKEKMEK